MNKIVIADDDCGAMSVIWRGLGRGFSYLGCDVTVWNIKQMSEFDMIDKIKPDIIFGQTYNLTDAFIKIMQENPHIRLILRASDRSKFANEVKKQFDILVANEKEIELVNRLRDKTGKPDLLHNHYTQESINKTHEDWINDGFKTISLLSAADPMEFYGGEFREEFASDICFIGRYLPLKSKSINENLIPWCGFDSNYNIKIFGHSGWPLMQYCGPSAPGYAKHFLKSAKVCPNLTEEHGRIFGYDINDRIYKLLLNKCLCISDYVSDAVGLFPEVVFCKTGQEFKEQIDYWCKKEYDDPERLSYIEAGFQNVKKNHTYIDRASMILDLLNIYHIDKDDIKKRIFNE